MSTTDEDERSVPEVADRLREIADALESGNLDTVVSTATEVLETYRERDSIDLHGRVSQVRSGMVSDPQFRAGEADVTARYVNAETSATMLRYQFATAMETLVYEPESAPLDEFADLARTLADEEETVDQLEEVARPVAERQPDSAYPGELTLANTQVDRRYLTPGGRTVAEVTVENTGEGDLSNVATYVHTTEGISATVDEAIPTELSAGDAATAMLELAAADDQDVAGGPQQVTVDVRVYPPDVTPPSDADPTTINEPESTPTETTEDGFGPDDSTSETTSETATSTPESDRGPLQSLEAVISVTVRSEEAATAYRENVDELRVTADSERTATTTEIEQEASDDESFPIGPALGGATALGGGALAYALRNDLLDSDDIDVNEDGASDEFGREESEPDDDAVE